MTEPTPQDPTDQQVPPISPETTFYLTKAAELLSYEALTHTFDEIIDGRASDQDSTLFFYQSNNECFGDLAEWDGKFFSFTDKRMATTKPDANFIAAGRGPVENGSQSSPAGTTLRIGFNAGGTPQDGEVAYKEVALRGEFPPLVQERTYTAANETSNFGEWRDMTETEGQGLLLDVVELTGRLQDYLKTNPGPLFKEPEDYEKIITTLKG